MDFMESPRLRLERAVKHINEFWQETEKYLISNPFGTGVEEYEENGNKCLNLFFRVYREPPKYLGIIAGDCIHNLRSVLDNIVWSLGQAYPSTDSSAYSNKLYFPVYKKEIDYKKDLKNKPALKGINNFPLAAQQLIESMQPYNLNPKGRLLSVLHDLWNADKHRSPDLMGMANRGVSLKGYNLQQPAGLSAGNMMKDGFVFAYGVIPECGIEQDAKIELIDIELCFHENGPASGYVARIFLYELLQFINEVLIEFEPIFPVSVRE